MIEVLAPFLPIIIPIVVIPIIMKFIIAPLIFNKLKTKYFIKLTATIKEGWVDDRDIEAIEYLKANAWKDVKNPFVISYNFNFLKKQGINIFYNISKIYDDSNTLNLEFSLQKIIEALYLLFEDLHKDLKELKIYSFLEKLPLALFLRIKNFNNFIKIFTRHRIIRTFQKYRITVKFLRVILIPIIGVPILLSQLFFSLLYSTLLEGYMRFIYGLILIKVGYYAIYLYSNRNSSLHNRIEFDHKDIIYRGKIIKDVYTTFHNREKNSPHLNEALEILKKELENLNIMPSETLSREETKLKRAIKRIKFGIKNTVKSELGEVNNENFILKELTCITNSVSKAYFPKASPGILQLRAKEFIELGYFATNICLKSIYEIPGLRTAMDKIPLKFIIKINSFLEEKQVKKYLPHIKKGNRLLANTNKYFLASKLLLKKTNPATFIISIISPIVYQQVQDSLKEYIYNAYGLLLIDSFESTVLKNNSNKISEIL